ncbi:hypothetical protein DPMN_066708 [Dreissena polymorpha]|uniref:Uncharacterized protein n=1 Tax=Dreissena polymorpha TaxID=45954 RepID=A0A9D3YYY5_DREPO|nr:hypothetical protein DPMN_066708 [Dreissena polymorpha]
MRKNDFLRQDSRGASASTTASSNDWMTSPIFENWRYCCWITANSDILLAEEYSFQDPANGIIAVTTSGDLSLPDFLKRLTIEKGKHSWLLAEGLMGWDWQPSDEANDSDREFNIFRAADVCQAEKYLMLVLPLAYLTITFNTCDHSPSEDLFQIDLSLSMYIQQGKTRHSLRSHGATEKTAPPPGGHVFSSIWTIFKLVRDINETNVLTKFHDDWAKIVTFRVFTRNIAPHPGCHVLKRTGIIFELNQQLSFRKTF